MTTSSRAHFTSPMDKIKYRTLIQDASLNKVGILYKYTTRLSEKVQKEKSNILYVHFTALRIEANEYRVNVGPRPKVVAEERPDSIRSSTLERLSYAASPATPRDFEATATSLHPPQVAFGCGIFSPVPPIKPPPALSRP